MSSGDEYVTAGNARKRRRLNPRFEPSSEQLDEPASSDSPQSLHDGTSSRGGSEPRQEQQQPQKPKYRIHIVQNPEPVEDEYFSQAPTATDDPHRIRGAYWVKPKPSPPQLQPPSPPQTNVIRSPPARPVSRRIEPPQRPHQDDNSRPTPIRPNPIVERSSPRKIIDLDLDDSLDVGLGAGVNIEPDDHEAALMEELADFPSDDFHSPGASPTDRDAAYARELASQEAREAQRGTRMVAPQNNLRQTTLFGAAVRDDGTATQASQTNRMRNWPAANRDEPPTHHKLDEEAMQTAVYPTNLGTIRDYQYNIVLRGLYNNLLVALPTGLGKTFIAATVMLNWYRWTKDAQIVFVAPTRPLVAQQVDACFHIAGIPRSATTLLTGQTAPGLRAEEWESKRVFFMTPQTIINDLKTGICDPKRIVLVVVDEAHRATGNYAYVEVVKFLRRFNTSFRVLALTATPGSTVEAVQEVIDGLGIARTEIRTEESLDIRQYVHQRNIETMLFDFNDEMLQIMEMLSEAIKPVQAKLNSMNAYWGKDPMTLTAYGCTIARQKWMNSPAGRNANWGLKGMVNSIFNVLAGLAHAIELLKFHGIGPFYRKVQNPSNSDKKDNKYERQIREHESFQKMLVRLSAWCGHPDFVGHPKLEHLSSVVLNHFMDRGEGADPEAGASSTTRVMIFAHFRDSAEEIARVLDRHGPLVRPHVFVGQASTNGSEGMDQKKQQEIIGKFKQGTYNTLVATSIGEEGLDIGEVDLIVCYDASASPIRMLQRMGRTGRKRAGNISVLLMKQKEQDNFEKAKDNYEKMQQMIAAGDRFQYHLEQSPRIVPKGTEPRVDKRVVEIPIENSQAELPEPKKRKGKQPKRPPKKFHMPDGVITGFMQASEIGGDGTSKGTKARRARSPTPDPVPDVSTVVLSESQNIDLESRFLYISGEQSEVVEYPGLDKFPALQRQSRPTKLLDHGRATRKMMAMLKRMHRMDESSVELYEQNLQPEDQELVDKARAGDAAVLLDAPFPNSRERLDIASNPESEIEADPAPKPARKRKTPTTKTPAPKKPRTTKDTATVKKTATKKATTAKGVRESASANKAPVSKKQSKKRTPPPPDPTQPLCSSIDNGIDIMDTDEDDDRNEVDDDNGSDLLDFIDDEPQAEAVPSSSADSLLSRTKQSKKSDRRRRQQPILSDGDNDKENETFSDLDEMLGLVPKGQATKPLRGGRKMVVDSDDEE